MPGTLEVTPKGSRGMLSLEMVSKKRTEIYCELETLLGMEGISTVSFVIFAWIFADSNFKVVYALRSLLLESGLHKLHIDG